MACSSVRSKDRLRSMGGRVSRLRKQLLQDEHSCFRIVLLSPVSDGNCRAGSLGEDIPDLFTRQSGGPLPIDSDQYIASPQTRFICRPVLQHIHHCHSLRVALVNAHTRTWKRRGTETWHELEPYAALRIIEIQGKVGQDLGADIACLSSGRECPLLVLCVACNNMMKRPAR